jgi:hypothetical protein
MLAYLCAMVLNAVVVLTCDCTSCHAHPTHTCMCGECAAFEEVATALTQHCECTHSHENRAEEAVTVDYERILKLSRVVVAELPRALVSFNDVTAMVAHQILGCPLSVPLDDDPQLWTCGLRAPPVFA